MTDNQSPVCATWQPIETAPRDGTPIWLRGNGIFHGVEFVAYRRKPEYKWQHWTWRTLIGDRDVSDHCVTHWMHRPEPPAQPRQEGGEDG